MSVTIYTKAVLPDELVQPFFQAIRDFDMKHDPKHEGKVQFQQLTEADWPMERMQAIFDAVSPSFGFKVIKKVGQA